METFVGTADRWKLLRIVAGWKLLMIATEWKLL
jgi:hypothetical protein